MPDYSPVQSAAPVGTHPRRTARSRAGRLKWSSPGRYRT
jgi:hypothetical protein